MKTLLNKVMLAVLAFSLLLAGLPLSSAQAAGLTADPTPTAPVKDPTARLEAAFARQTKRIEKVGKLYAQADLGFPKLQARIDKAKAKGIDVSTVQAALDAVKQALKTARPLYDQAKSIADAHKGFDSAGKVTDQAAALETVKSFRETAKQFKTAMGGTVKALHEAIKALRQNRK